MSTKLCALVVLFTCVLLGTLQAAKETQTAMLGGNPSQTAETGETGPLVHPRIVWRSRAPVSTHPPIVSQSVVLLASSKPVTFYGLTKGCVFAIDAENGTERWRFCNLNAPIHGSLAVWDNNVYVGTQEGLLYTLALKNGDVKQVIQREATPSTPFVISEGYLFFGSASAVLWEFPLRGGTDRRFELPISEEVRADHELGNMWSAPAIHEGVAYCSVTDEGVYALRLEDGKVLWRHPVEGMYLYGTHVDSRPTVVNDRVVFAKSLDWLYCVEKETGELAWRFRMQKPFLSSPAAKDGLLYVSSNDGRVYALRVSDGEVAWRFDPKGTPGNPSIGGQNIFFGTFGDQGGWVYSLELKTGHVQFAVEVGASVVAAPAVHGSALYVVGREGELFKLQATPKNNQASVQGYEDEK